MIFFLRIKQSSFTNVLRRKSYVTIVIKDNKHEEEKSGNFIIIPVHKY